jgi:hypothetical protein
MFLEKGSRTFQACPGFGQKQATLWATRNRLPEKQTILLNKENKSKQHPPNLSSIRFDINFPQTLGRHWNFLGRIS